LQYGDGQDVTYSLYSSSHCHIYVSVENKITSFNTMFMIIFNVNNFMPMTAVTFEQVY
jgi:hypothetical protein